MRNTWLIALAAVLVGNVVYFFLMPHLPPAARHEPFRVDAGLAIDAVICVAFWGLFHLIGRRPR